MTIIISSFALLVFIGMLVFAEHRQSRRSAAFFKKSDEAIADLSSRVEQRYRDKYGKDPTGKFITVPTPTNKKTATKPV